jgi:hypothetical protein
MKIPSKVMKAARQHTHYPYGSSRLRRGFYCISKKRMTTKYCVSIKEWTPCVFLEYTNKRWKVKRYYGRHAVATAKRMKLDDMAKEISEVIEHFISLKK